MMFSKFGKVLSYQFHILLSKDEILSNTRSKRKKRRKVLKAEKDSISTRDNDNFSQTPEIKPPSHIFRSQSRDDFYKTVAKVQTPPVGYYNCNYSCVSKSPKSAVFKKRKKTVSRVKNPVDTSAHFSTYVERPKTPVVNFQKQLPRNNIFIAQLNENRFLSFKNMPEVCSNFKRTSTPDIGKISARPEVLINSSISLNSYNVDFRAVKQDLGKVIDFNKCSPRKPLFEGKKDLRSYEINWKSIDKNKSYIDFNKSCPSPKP